MTNATTNEPINAMRQHLNPYEDLLVLQCMKASPMGFSILLALSVEESVNVVMDTLHDLSALPESSEIRPSDRVIRAHAADIRREAITAAFQSLGDAAKKAVDAKMNFKFN